VSDRPALRELAARLGINDEYESALDSRPVWTSDRTREALVAAMGHDGSTEAAARASLAALDADGGPLLESERVVGWESEGVRSAALAWPSGAPQRVRYELEIGPEDDASARIRGGGWLTRGEVVPLPAPKGPGILKLDLRLTWEGGACQAGQRIVATPHRCLDVDEVVGPGGAFGLWTHLYSARSGDNWGFGNFEDLRTLVDLAAGNGAAFVGLNPLHTLPWPPGTPSPYLPQSRLFLEPLYLAPERIPEWDRCSSARQLAAQSGAAIEALRRSARLDAGAVERVLRPVLALLHAEFARRHAGGDSARGRAYARFVSGHGTTLRDFATFRALAEHFTASGTGPDWRRWPAAYADPASGAVSRFREEHADEVAFHAWLQFELDRQLGLAAERSRSEGMPIGLLTDLALGSDPGGSDAWAHRDCFARGVTAGAPPDAFSREGQNWSFPPLDPARLGRGGFGLWWRLLGAALAHAGALRLDHALGLRRLFWIPEGAPPAEGAYVTYPEEALLGLLALASQHHRALVIGEDLGTVPEGFSERLQSRGVLSSRVLLFERDAAGFRSAGAYPRRCLATANTHDLPPLAALAGDEDLALRRRAGQLPDDHAWRAAVADRVEERAALVRRLREEGGCPAGGPGAADLAAAVTRFLCATPARLVGLALDDLIAEEEPLNLPGVPPWRHPSWTRRQRVPLDQVAHHPVARACLDAVPPARRASAPSDPRPVRGR